MKEFEIIKQLEYLIAFQSECLNKGDLENFDRSENIIKKLEEILIDPAKKNYPLEKELKSMLQSLQKVSIF